MKLLNVFPFKAGDRVVQVPVSDTPHVYYVTGCSYGRYGGSGPETVLVSIASAAGRNPFGTYPCEWFIKETNRETA